ncbi:hypothetical protein [Thermobifida cellulosilytica]|uniref:RING-type E3 ubiquitin transferase n=1 Tax=Thermobifida cellulosilytica TB100 TaxID=665004 RepID=A0A147KE13_THECS|nr:hypothetical protein [Thermobifida cellulosilytica]KUP95546.1 hypothetical protein AC529_17075 [Thermobifida cellulosilytica TB100]
MLVIGMALLVGAAVLAPAGFVALRRWMHRRDLAELRPRAFVALVGSEVTLHGLAAAGPGGTVESRLAGVECVWHGHEVVRHYATWRTLEETGEREQVLGDDTIADYGSPEPFALTGADGGRPGEQPILVDPEEADTTRVSLCLQRVVARPQRGVPAPADDLLGRIKGRVSGVFRGETIEFEYRERAIRVGDPVVVRGRVELRDGRPVVAAPADGRLSIEHDEAAPPSTVGRPRNALLLGAGALVSGVTGLLLVLAGG